jgi:hypothetical protein
MSQRRSGKSSYCYSINNLFNCTLMTFLRIHGLGGKVVDINGEEEARLVGRDVKGGVLMTRRRL